MGAVVSTHMTTFGQERAKFNSKWEAVLHNFVMQMLLAPSKRAAQVAQQGIDRRMVVMEALKHYDMKRLTLHLLAHARASASSLQLPEEGSGIDAWVDTPPANTLLAEPALAFSMGINSRLNHALRNEAKRDAVVKRMTFDDASASLMMLAMAEHMQVPADVVVWRGERLEAAEKMMMVYDSRMKRCHFVPLETAANMGYTLSKDGTQVTLKLATKLALPKNLSNQFRGTSISSQGLDPTGKSCHLGRVEDRRNRIRWDEAAVGATAITNGFMSTSYQRATGERFAMQQGASTSKVPLSETSGHLLKIIVRAGTRAVPIHLLGSLFADKDEDELALASGTLLRVRRQGSTTVKGRRIGITELETVRPSAPQKSVLPATDSEFQHVVQFRLLHDFVVEHLMRFHRLTRNSRGPASLQSMFSAKWIGMMFEQLLDVRNYDAVIAQRKRKAHLLLINAMAKLDKQRQAEQARLGTVEVA